MKLLSMKASLSGGWMIDLAEVQKMANLARLEVGEEKAREYAQQLQRVLAEFEIISRIPTEGVEPLITPTEIESYWREDENRKEVTTEELLANAPDRIGNLFRVPPVI
jgi:aspartyl-tRNA(Asn)/glutamyl-tRNA(Gln) amidotransferase subunit C